MINMVHEYLTYIHLKDMHRIYKYIKPDLKSGKLQNLY